ncbi:MAG: outer membrane beta-barrel protein [Rhodospirillales bacterium]
MKISVPAVMTAIGTTALLASHPAGAGDRLKDDFTFTYQIEVAGADTTDMATDKQLRDSGMKMIPAQPSAKSRDPLKQDASQERKTAAPEKTPADSPKVAPAASEATQNAPANAAQEARPEPESAKKTATAKPETLKTESGKDLLFRPYLRIDTGYTMTNDPDGTGANGQHRVSGTRNTELISLGLGAKVDDQMRAEGMITYRSPMEIDGTNGAGNAIAGEVDSISAMFNLYYDFEQLHQWLGGDTFTPYVGAGVGLSMLDTSFLTTAGGNTEYGAKVYNLTYAAMGGVSARVSEAVSIDVGYRFINLGQYEQDGTFTTGPAGTATKYDDLFAHEFRAGLRFQF